MVQLGFLNLALALLLVRLCHLEVRVGGFLLNLVAILLGDRLGLLVRLSGKLPPGCVGSAGFDGTCMAASTWSARTVEKTTCSKKAFS